ncbi:hypothetical protein ACOME3_008065 [Neoechinorhynchus agilis]
MTSVCQPTEVTDQTARQLIEAYDCFIFDCDGVLWKWSSVFQGVPEFLNYLIQAGKRVYFLTNNSSKSRQIYLDKLIGFGVVGIDKTNIVPSSWLIAEYLKSIGFGKKVYAIGESGIVDELKEVGITTLGAGPDPFPPIDYGSIKVDLDNEVGCVVVGFDRHVSLLKILKASSYAKRKGCLFIAANDDANFPGEEGNDLVYPGTGSILASVVAATGLRPMVLGKPHSSAFHLLQKIQPMNSAKCLMVGDRLETDIAFGNRHGMSTLAVFTGHTNLEEINQFSKQNNDFIPKYYVDSLGALWKMIK